MTLHVLDHLYAILFFLAFPVVDTFLLRAQARRIRAGETHLRAKIYGKIMLYEWSGLVVLLITWFALGRSAASLGLVPRFGPLAWAGYGLAGLFCGLLLAQERQLRTRPDLLSKVREQSEVILALTPHTGQDLRRFDRVSVTAGICEEALYRGFGIAYFMSLLGAPFWMAAVITSVAFGLAHSYQGPAGAAKAGLVGAGMALLFGMTGSLWAPMVAHAALDMISGRITLAANRAAGPDEAPSELAA